MWPNSGQSQVTSCDWARFAGGVQVSAVLDGWGVLGDHQLRRADRVALCAA
jgi:hypothetical protein